MHARTAKSVLVVVVLLLSGGCGEKVDQKKLIESLGVDRNNQERLIGQIRKRGGRLERDEQSLARPAVWLVFAERPLSDADLRCLKELGNLRGLSLRGLGVTDAGLEHVRGLGRLQALELNFTGVTDAGLVHLKGLTELRSLNLDGSFQVTDAGLSHLKDLANLEALSLTFTQVTDAGIKELQEALPELRIHRRYRAGRGTAKAGDPAVQPPRAVPAGMPATMDGLRQAGPGLTGRDPTGLALRLEQTLRSKPDSIETCVFQGWNLCYNLPIDLEDHRQRYHWVKQGLQVLADGAKNNPNSPRLPWEIGWIVSQKIGRGDDARGFRRMFADDTDLHEILIAGLDRDDVLGPAGKPDNWLVAKQWFNRATDLVDNQGAAMPDKSPLIFRSGAPMCQMNYAAALEEEGRFDQLTRQAWNVAAEDWDRYGWCEIRTARRTASDEPVIIRLNDLDKGKNLQRQVQSLVKQLEALAPGLRETIRKQKQAGLTEEQRRALSIPRPKRTARQRALAAKAQEQVRVPHEEVAQRIADPQNRARALRLGKALRRAEATAATIRRYREIVNFSYWRLRAEVEQTDETVAARKAIYEADRDLERGELQTAKDNYTKGLAAWRNVADRFPEIVTNETFGFDLMEVIGRYRRLLEIRDEPFPDPFLLQDVLDLHEEQWARSKGPMGLPD